jgi:predicted 2-oxoglutarate/Fe(II)-dependent dioxygenase YbiX
MPQPSIISDDSTSDFFVPTPGQTEWWKGNAEQFPLLKRDEEHASLVQRRNVLSHAQCDVLIDCFKRQKTLKAAHTGSSFWDGRYIWQNNIPLTEIDALRIMQQARFVAQITATQEFQPPKPLYSDTAQIVLWTEGIELTPHADNLEPDGRPNGTPHRRFSSLIYLNEDYDGGETYFPGFGVRVKPERGLLIIFGSGPEYVHGVTKVRRGKRYTYAGWFSCDPALEDRNARVVF